ncbi:MAG: hypothetical protein HOW73_03465 [Polyangiaceae bacterium]|nr:hypothetical protein [Polyangiaceae bacterium]
MTRLWFRLLVPVAAMASMGADCGGEDPPPVEEEDKVTLSSLEVVVPANSELAGAPTQTSNNNLDVVRYNDRTFLAWRTAPSHFASEDTVMNVASEGPDGWRFEGSFTMGTDLREPRFLVLGDKLFLYFAVLGTDPFAFEPQGMMVTEYHGPEDWDAPEPLYEDGFIPWRAKVENGKAYLIGYVGGENIYEVNGEPIRIHFLTTTDGRTLEPVVPGQPVVQEGGGSETDFTFLDDGTLVAVTRNEAGDEASGWGSKICRAEAGDLGNWQCKSDKKKYDSPLVFRNGDQVWLVGRRNMTETGNYDLDMDELSAKDQTEKYLIDYSFNPKRCALWRVDPDTLTVKHEVDLPSRGDTCFASQLPKSADVVTLYNYSNELDGASDCKQWPNDCTDITWWVGQGQATIVYRIDATFP